MIIYCLIGEAVGIGEDVIIWELVQVEPYDAHINGRNASKFIQTYSIDEPFLGRAG